MIYKSIKRFLGQNRLTRIPYHALARSAHALQFLFYKARFGRAYPSFYFDRLFARGADPWQYEGDAVAEKRKSLILGLLPSVPVSSILEIGCASGWITRDLASRASKVTAVDCSSVALSLARERCKDCANIEFAEIDLFMDEIEGSFELVMCAGVLNFFPMTAQPAIRDKIVGSVRPGGRLLLEHMRESMPGYEVPGRELHRLYAEHPQLAFLDRMEEDIYEIVLFERVT